LPKEKQMIEWLYIGQLVLSTAAGCLAVILGLAKRKPSNLSLGALAIVELGLVIQFVVSIVLVIMGQRAQSDTVEFFAYLVVALMVPIGAAFWALIERSRWATVVLGVGALTVAVMLVRMQQLWTETF
jgi:hypothetical protein